MPPPPVVPARLPEKLQAEIEPIAPEGFIISGPEVTERPVNTGTPTTLDTEPPMNSPPPLLAELVENVLAVILIEPLLMMPPPEPLPPAAELAPKVESVMESVPELAIPPPLPP